MGALSIRRYGRRGAAGAALIVGFLALLVPATAAAKTFEVTRTNDPAPGSCNGGGCTIREAFIAANNHAGADAIELRRGKSYTLAQPGNGEDAALTGDLDSTGKLTLRASGKGKKRAKIDGATLDRVLDLNGPTTINAIEIRGGSAQSVGDDSGNGGGIQITDGDLRLLSSTVKGNTASASGAGIASVGVGDVLLTGSHVDSNQGFGIFQNGNGRVALSHSSASRNVSEAISDMGPGGISLNRSHVDKTDGQGLVDFDGGGIKLVRSHVDKTGDQAVVDFNGGGISLNASSVDETDGQAVLDFGGGSVRLTKSTVNRATSQAVLDFDAGNVVLERSHVDHAAGDGVIDFGPGTAKLSRSTVNDAGGRGVENFDGAPLAIRRSHVNGAQYVGVEDFSDGTTTIDRSTVNGSGQQGLEAFGDLKLTRSSVNGSADEGVQLFGDRATISDVSVSHGGGTAIASFSARVKLSGSTVDDNKGTGVIIDGSETSIIETSAITNNRSSNDGGGVAASANLSIARSTIAGNRAAGFGGGIAADGTSANIALNGVTLARNEADTGGSGGGGGLSNLNGATTSVKNSLLAKNINATGPDACLGSFTSGGGNLRTDPGALCAGFEGPGDAIKANARIGKLASNGGPTKTIALKHSSPAVGRARGTATTRDQRDFKRDGKPDSGAYELGAKRSK